MVLGVLCSIQIIPQTVHTAREAMEKTNEKAESALFSWRCSRPHYDESRHHEFREGRLRCKCIVSKCSEWVVVCDDMGRYRVLGASPAHAAGHRLGDNPGMARLRGRRWPHHA